MNRRVDRVNRVVLAALGLLALAGGGWGLWIGLRLRSSTGSSTASSTNTRTGDFPVWSQFAKDWVADQRLWFWPTVIGLSVVLGILGLTWLIAQTRTDRLARLELAADPAGGGTTIAGRALLDAVGAEIAGRDGVRRATTRLIGPATKPHLLLRIEVAPDADLAHVRRQVEDHAVAHARQALEIEIPATIDFTVSTTDDPRTVA